MIGMKFDDVDGEEPKPVQPVRPETFGIGVWKTRSGRKAEIDKDKDCILKNYDLTGVIHFGKQAVEATWTRSGDFLSGRVHGNDLVGPWVEEAPVVEAPVVEAPVVEAPVVETPAVETPAVETPAVETPAVETPAVETPAVETPAVETPVVEAPVVEAPVVEAPVVEAPAFGLGMWRTQGGQRVDITRDLGSQYAFNLQGRVDSGIKMESWANDGTPMRDVSEPHLKLVGPWVDWQPVEKVAETPVVEAPKFGVGTWKTRNGSIARVDIIAKDKTYPLIGSIISGPDYPNGEEPDIDTTEMIWTAKGKVFFVTDSDVDPNDDPGLIDQSIWEEPHDLDLISPAVEEEPEIKAPVFGVGTWKTRNGSIARVDSIAGYDTYPLTGSIIVWPECANGAEPDPEMAEMTWTADGKVYFTTLGHEGLDELDLISPVVLEERKETKPANEDVLNLQSLCDKQKNSIQVLEDSIKSLTGMLRVSDRKVVHLDGELTSMAVLLRDAVRDAGRLKKLIAGLEEENVVQGYKLSAAIDERDTEKLKAKLDLDALKAVTEQKQNDTVLPAIWRMKVLLLACRIVAVLLLAAIPLAGQWIVQHGPEWMVDSSGKGILRPGTLFAAVVAWMGVCMIGSSIEGEIRRIIESQETEYWRLRNKVTPGRREDW